MARDGYRIFDADTHIIEPVEPVEACLGGTPWDVRWQGPPFPSDRVSFDPHARVKDMDPLMFATDYPHSESWFPKSVDAVLGWTSIPETARRKLLWGNASGAGGREAGDRRTPARCLKEFSH
jgi:hypothetical protein